MVDTRMSYEHALDYIKGWPNNPNALDVVAPLAPNLTKTNMSGGTVASIDSSGQFVPGANGVPGVFLHCPNANDVPGETRWFSVDAESNWSGLSSLGPYELATTEYDTGTDRPFAPNQPLASPMIAQVGATPNQAGLLYNKRRWTGGNGNNIGYYTDTIVGIVSPGVQSNPNHNGARHLCFYTYFLPPTA